SLRQKLVADELSAVVFGGGPGTELLGLAKCYLEQANGREHHQQVEIRVDVIDRVSAWSENVSWIKDEISRVYSGRFGKRRDWPALFDIHTFNLNFSDLECFGNLPSLFQRDIFVLNFVVSEVFDFDELLPIMRKMVAGCAAGAHFLFVDRADSETSRKVQELIKQLQLEIELADTTIDTMDVDEEKTELQRLSDFVGKQPRLRWNAEWVLAVKARRHYWPNESAIPDSY